MELLIKLYNDRPSRIAVKYIYEYQAVREYEALLQKYPDDTFQLRLEIIKNRITLTLCSDSAGTKIIYKDLEFKTDQVKKLQLYYTPGSPLDFVHVFPKSNQLLVAKPFRTIKFFSVSDLAVIVPANTGTDW